MKKPKTQQENQQLWLRLFIILSPISIALSLCEKTHLVLLDPDDYSNGAAYYYDNKIVIWASPLDFELRGSHRWLQNVITHEFAHIVSLQKSMKMGTRIPGGYLQIMNYEKENRPDVLYGYPNSIISYPFPGTCIPPWFAGHSPVHV